MDPKVLKIPEENERPGKTTASARKKLVAADYNKDRSKYEWKVFNRTLVGECAGDHEFEYLLHIKEDGERERTPFIRCGLTKCKVGNIEAQLIESYVNKNIISLYGTYGKKSGWH